MKMEKEEKEFLDAWNKSQSGRVIIPASMTLGEYQERAMTTCMPSCDNFSYMMLNLVGEVGEFASKVAKAIRREEVEIGEWVGLEKTRKNDLNFIVRSVDSKEDTELKKEAGDILWQLAGLCKVMGWSLEEVAQLNLDKLAERKKNGTIDGSGDGVTKEERL